MTVKEVTTREGYARWAESYDVPDNPMVGMDQREVPPLLGGVRGLDLVELGCGTGRNLNSLKGQAASLIGLDNSPEMLAIAKKKLAGSEVRLLQQDLTEPLPLADQAADLVFSTLVLEHLRELQPFYDEAARITKNGGRLVFSTMHPAMFLRGKQAHYDDPESGITYQFQSYDHQVADFVMAGLRANLTLVEVAEHRVDEALIKDFPGVAKYLDWPFLATLVFQKEN